MKGINLTASNILSELERMYSQIPEELLLEKMALRMNKHTKYLYILAAINRSGNPIVPENINFIGIPIVEDNTFPNNTMIITSEKFSKELTEAYEYFKNQPWNQ